MRTFEQLGEIVAWLQDLHHRMAGRYRQHGEQIADRRAAMLLKHAARLEKDISEALGRWLARTDRETLAAYFQYVIQDDDLALFDEIDIRSDMTADDVANALIMATSRLGLLYRRLAEMSDFEDAAELFTHLAERSESERDQVTANLQQLKDL